MRVRMPPRTIPMWTNEEKRLFLVIAKRRKEEHVSAYACVSIGAQLFATVSDDVAAICADDEDIDEEDEFAPIPIGENRNASASRES